MDEEPTKNSNGIVDPAKPEATAPVPESAPVTPPTGVSGTPGLTSEKVLDIALGVAVIAGEALDKAAQRLSERAKELQDQSPSFWETAEERGRPVREKMVSTLRGTTTTTEGTAPGGGSSSSGGSGSGLADSLRNLGKDIGITVGGGNARLSAEDEIRGLEDRVRELEQVVVSGKTGTEPAPIISEVESAPAEAETPAETTAESSSYAFGVDQYEDILASSPYAVSETEEEQSAEASALTTDAESAPETDITLPTGDAMTSETALPATVRPSRKKQRDLDPEVTDESAPTPSPEG